VLPIPPSHYKRKEREGGGRIRTEEAKPNATKSGNTKTK